MSSKWLSILIAIFALSLFSCNEEKVASKKNSSTLSLYVDKKPWIATDVQATYANNIITIEASGDQSTQLEITLQKIEGTGTVQLQNISLGIWTAGEGEQQSFTTGGGLGGGTLEMASLSKSEAKGTYSFSAGNGLGTSVVITDGKFDIEF